VGVVCGGFLGLRLSKNPVIESLLSPCFLRPETSLIFRHGTLDVSWNDNGLDEEKDARNKAFKVTATEIRQGNGLILRLADGGTIKIPISGWIDVWG